MEGLKMELMRKSKNFLVHRVDPWTKTKFDCKINLTIRKDGDSFKVQSTVMHLFKGIIDGASFTETRDDCTSYVEALGHFHVYLGIVSRGDNTRRTRIADGVERRIIQARNDAYNRKY
jgi:hypothetical protein